MTIESALETAIEYEKKVRDVYAEASNESVDEMGRKVFAILAEEEASHVAYLEFKLRKYIESKSLSADDIKTAMSQASTQAGNVENLRAILSEEQRDNEIALLIKARKVERETSEFYQRMVAELPEEGRQFFRRFLEIEEGHFDVVQYEIDSLMNTGFWMGMQEFDMEAID